MVSTSVSKALNRKPLYFFIHPWIAVISAFVFGYLYHFSLAPYNFWPIGIISATVLALLLIGCSAKQAFWRAYLFGLGKFLGGTAWVHVSIHDVSLTPEPLATIMTVAFCGFLALVFALPFIFYQKYIGKTFWGFSIGFAVVWSLGEWLRTWFLTGFPWLFLGYGHVDTFLSGWAPIVGVIGISFFAIASSTFLLASLFNRHKKTIAISVSLFLMCYAIGFLLQSVEWTKTIGPKIETAIIQPNIPLYKKWNPKYAPEIEGVLHKQMSAHWDSDLIILPENAIPYLYNEATHFLSYIQQKGIDTQTNIVAGILTDEIQNDFSYRYYNSIVGEGITNGIYHKQRLVPFGEYVPLEKWLRGIIHFFNLPTSYIQIGPLNPKGLEAQTRQHGEFKIAPFICYEIVYPDLVAKNSRDAKLLITISNDAWFGASIGPLQHYQMAQMRALEHQKFLIRGTNTGLSGFIDPKGKSVLEGKQFVEQTIVGEVFLREGSTPYAITRSWPLIIGLFIILIYLYRKQRGQEGSK